MCPGPRKDVLDSYTVGLLLLPPHSEGSHADNPAPLRNPGHDLLSLSMINHLSAHVFTCVYTYVHMCVPTDLCIHIHTYIHRHTQYIQTWTRSKDKGDTEKKDVP